MPLVSWLERVLDSAPAALVAAALPIQVAAPSPSTKPIAAMHLSPAQADALVREISGKVEGLRRLKFKTPVTVQVIENKAAREAFRSKVSPEAEVQLRHATNAYVQLGLIPQNADLLKGLLNTAEHDVLGYYEPGSKTFFLMSNVAAADVRSVIAHELTHALEDQNYDLAALSKQARNEDHATAISALIEGSATVVMLAFLSREENEQEARRQLEKNESERVERSGIAPTFTQRTLLLPYILGFTFLLRGKPWGWITEGGVYLSDLERAYARPPVSTRQVLHPEQYWREGSATSPVLTLPDLSPALGPGWTKTLDGAIGELGLAVLTGSNQRLAMPWAMLPSRWTNVAAAGNAGDVYHHYVNGDQKVTVLLTRWESPGDAEEFGQALTRKGRYFFRYGVNFLMLSGDFADKAEALAARAMAGRPFFADE